MTEARVLLEGTLRGVQASGTGLTWATATSPPSAIYGFVDSFTFNSAQTVTTISNRGIPDHNKITEKAPIDVTFNFIYTGSYTAFATASGSTVPMQHIEWRASAAEQGAGSGFYYQFYGAALKSIKNAEAKDGDKVSVNYVCLGMNGPTASGYLS
jgi:hypothetical protein